MGWGERAMRGVRATVVEEFEEQVRRNGERVAVESEGGRLSYGQLNEKANQVARRLREKHGIGEGDLVGLMVERSLEMVIGIWGILKAGAGYVPLEPDYPGERIGYIVRDAGLGVVLSQGKWRERVPGGVEVELLEGESLYGTPSGGNGEPRAGGQSVAYVIYTSGSTGKPKGVVIEHGSLHNLLWSLQENYPVGEQSVLLLKTPYTFDVSAGELFGWVMGGGKLALLAPGGEKDPAEVTGAIGRWGVSHVNFVPAQLGSLLEEPGQELVERLRSVEYVMAAGEAISGKIVGQWQGLKLKGRLINLYGPTELTVYVTQYECGGETGGSVPIGRPLANTRAYVLGERGELLPVGVAGELCFSGVQVARGYLNAAALTQEKFVRDEHGEGGRMYRTGDLGRWLPDGNLEYLGRKDDQVKIRGYRIELGEVENVLLGQDGVRQAAVVAREVGGQGVQLCAYVAAGVEKLPVAQLKEGLARQLPAYMIPAFWTQVETLPLNANGKIDRKALPEPQRKPADAPPSRPPSSPVEIALGLIWQDILHLPDIGVHDNFFKIGGHSLLAVRIIARINQAFKVDLKVGEIFENPTLETLAKRIQAGQKMEEYQQLTAGGPQAPGQGRKLSYSQERLWILEEMEGGMTAYNVSHAIRMVGEVDTGKVEESLRAVMRRHEILRTVFETGEGEGEQVVGEETRLRLEVEEVEGGSREEREGKVRERLREEMGKPFDLRRGPLMRARMYRMGAGDQVLFLSLHHIVCDEWSMQILWKELIEHYRAQVEGRQARVKALAIQYGDYAQWQRQWLKGERLEREMDYWEKKLKGHAGVLELPADHARPAIKSYRGGWKGFEVSVEITRRLVKISEEEGITLYMLLLSAYRILLYRYSGQGDILIGSPIAGRNRAETEGLIGFFVNTVVLRNPVKGGESFREVLKRERETALEAYNHQEMPFEMLVGKLQPERDPGRSPLFQAMFTLRGEQENPGKVPEVELEEMEMEGETAKFDLLLGMSQRGEKLHGGFEYSEDLYGQERMERMAGHYVEVLRGISEGVGVEVGEIELVGEREKRQLVEEYGMGERAMRGVRATVVEEFEEQVRRNGERVAVESEGGRLSYGQLNEKANQVARRLREKHGIGEGDLVGLMVERSLEMVIGIWGILKAGAGYVPLEPDYPGERIGYIVRDAGLGVVLSQGKWRERVPGGVEVELLEGESLYGTPSGGNGEPRAGGQSVAYVIYTSGSTGKPKGVVIEHGSLHNLLWSLQENYPVGEQSVLLLKTPYTFDVSAGELFGWVMGGGKLALLAPGGEKDPAEVTGAIGRWGVSHVNFVPAQLGSLLEEPGQELVERLRSVEYVMAAGEAISGKIVGQWQGLKLKGRLINLYGPTEMTVYVTQYECGGETGGSVPIGRPLANTRAYVLGERGELLPVGVAGGTLFFWGAGGEGVPQRGRADAGKVRERRARGGRADVSDGRPGEMAAGREP